MRGHILVTGSSGFIGDTLVKILIDAGYTVSSISRTSSESKTSFPLDLTVRADVQDYIKKSEPIDVIIHCAAIAHGENPPKNYSVSEFNSIMIDNLLSAFPGKHPHWIFLSSISVYGDSYLECPVPIKEKPLPSDNYGYGKLHDEQTLIKACDHLDILRLMPVYESFKNKDIKKRVFIPKTGIKLRILPAPSYSLCHIDVLVKKIFSCLTQTSAKRIHQVGNDEPTSQEEISKTFKGCSLTIPQKIFVFLLFIIPNKLGLFREIRFMIKKLGLSNTYELGTRELKY